MILQSPYPAAPALSPLMYATPTWSFTNSAAEAVTKFSTGQNRNRLIATGTTSTNHTLQRTFTVTAGLSYTLSILGQADAVSTFLGFEFYNGGTFLTSAGRFNATTGQVTGTGAGTLTNLGGGLYRYDKTYTIPAGMTALTVRLLVGNSSGTGSFVANGEAVFVSELTFSPV